MVTGAKENKQVGGGEIPAMNGRVGECRFFYRVVRGHLTDGNI